jgi:K+-sensing histidine kinase KdpD
METPAAWSVRSAPERVLVLCEQGRAGAAAIDLAREFAERRHANLMVVAVAPQAPSGPRCGNSAVEYNEAVAESVAQDLDGRARDSGARPSAPSSCC